MTLVLLWNLATPVLRAEEKPRGGEVVSFADYRRPAKDCSGRFTLPKLERPNVLFAEEVVQKIVGMIESQKRQTFLVRYDGLGRIWEWTPLKGQNRPVIRVDRDLDLRARRILVTNAPFLKDVLIESPERVKAVDEALLGQRANATVIVGESDVNLDGALSREGFRI